MNSMTDNWRTKLGSFLSPLSVPVAGEGGAPPAEARPDPVLIVDDDTDWASECAFSLRALGYEPLVAANPDQALEMFMTHDVSIAIVDYNMPGQDGITLMHEMAQAAEAQGRK